MTDTLPKFIAYHSIINTFKNKIKLRGFTFVFVTSREITTATPFAWYRCEDFPTVFLKVYALNGETTQAKLYLRLDRKAQRIEYLLEHVQLTRLLELADEYREVVHTMLFYDLVLWSVRRMRVIDKQNNYAIVPANFKTVTALLTKRYPQYRRLLTTEYLV